MTSTAKQLLARYSGVLAVILSWTETAFAHVQKGEAAGFLSGLRHRVSGADHVLGWWPCACGAHNWAHVQSGSSQSHFPWLWHSCMLALIGTPLPGIEHGIELQASRARIAVRVAGSWILASGLLLLGWAVRNAHMRASYFGGPHADETNYPEIRKVKEKTEPWPNWLTTPMDPP
jgi:hydrogenase/urease accessory protein HupE